MPVERRPDQYPDPPKELALEMSLTTALRRVVEDLFAHKLVDERLPELATQPELEPLLESWKQGLIHHLEEAAQESLQQAVAIIDMILTEDELPITPEERQEWHRIEQWYHPFAVASLCREDLRGIIDKEAIASLSDGDMKQIADKMGNAFLESGYWDSLGDAARAVLQQKQTPEPEPLTEPPDEVQDTP